MAEEQQPAVPAAPPQPSAPSGEQHCWVEEAGAGGPVEGHLTGKLRKSLQVSLVYASSMPKPISSHPTSERKRAKRSLAAKAARFTVLDLSEFGSSDGSLTFGRI